MIVAFSSHAVLLLFVILTINLQPTAARTGSLELCLSRCQSKPDACLYPSTLLIVSNFHVDGNLLQKLSLFKAYSRQFLATAFLALNYMNHSGLEADRAVLATMGLDVLHPSFQPPKKGISLCTYCDDFSYNEVADVLDILEDSPQYSSITSVLYIHADFMLTPLFRFSSTQLTALPDWKLQRLALADTRRWPHWVKQKPRAKSALADIVRWLPVEARVVAAETVAVGWSDLHSVPRALFREWAFLARQFARRSVLNEVAVPSIALLLAMYSNASRGCGMGVRIETVAPLGDCCWHMTEGDVATVLNGRFHSGHKLNLTNGRLVGKVVKVWEGLESRGATPSRDLEGVSEFIDGRSGICADEELRQLMTGRLKLRPPKRKTGRIPGMPQ